MSTDELQATAPAPEQPAPPAPAPEAAPEPGPAPASAPQGGSYAFLIGMSLINLIADLATKFWAEKTLQTPSLIPLPKPLFKGELGGFGFMLARNKGGAWGLLHSYDEKYRKPFFITVSLLAVIFIVSLYRKLHPSQHALRWGLPLVLGGALGNLVDRIRYGHVIDFIDFHATWGGLPHHWPTFNVADISICVGVGLMAVDMLTVRKHAPMTPPADPTPTAPEAPAEPTAPAAGEPPAAG